MHRQAGVLSNRMDSITGLFRLVLSKLLQRNRTASGFYFIAKSVGELAVQHRVVICGMEDIFFTKNVSSAIPIAKVIGACVHQLALLDIPVRLYSPPTIKTVVTGYGGAEKHQVQEMVRILLGFEEIPKPDHASDALAAALCLAVYDFTQIRMKL